MAERSLWKRRLDLDTLNSMSSGTLIEQLGIVFVGLGDDWVSAEMPVDARTRQPLGILHGGASVALAETLASVAGFLSLEGDVHAAGIAINANHVRSVKSGKVIGTARPVHIGRTTQVWEVRVEDERHRLVSICRMTAAVVAAP